MSYLLADSLTNLSKLTPNILVQKMCAQLDQSDINNSEVRSWENSLYSLIQLLNENNLGNLYLIAEYSLTAERRIDALLFGYTPQQHPLALIVELKQWSELGENYNNETTDVNVKLGLDYAYRMHPVLQTKRYEEELKLHHTSVVNQFITTDSIQYLHNFKQDKDVFFTGAYEDFKSRKDKLFIKGEESKLIDYLNSTFLKDIDGSTAADTFLAGKYTVGEIGFNGIKKVLRAEANATMIADQNNVSAGISRLIRSFLDNPRNMGIVIQGAAGTGKTIIGLYAMYLANKLSTSRPNTSGVVFNIDDIVFTFAKSKMLREVLAQEADQSYAFPYLDRIKPGSYGFIVVDEAHRMTDVNKTLYNLYGKDDRPKIVLFLQDDYQRVLPSENGTSHEINRILDLGQIESHSFKLEVQKRSGNQGSFVNKIHELFYNRQPLETKDSGKFIVDTNHSLKEIDTILKQHIDQGETAKWFAPYDWEWRSRNNLAIKDDISIIENDELFQKQWNPMQNQYAWHKGLTEDAFHQVGSVYTAQGLDYDYTGFIWFSDLYWDEYLNKWMFNLEVVKDPTFKKEAQNLLNKYNGSQQVVDFILNIVFNQYYVLLTRARKGIYIWFHDEATKRKFNSIINS